MRLLNRSRKPTDRRAGSAIQMLVAMERSSSLSLLPMSCLAIKIAVTTMIERERPGETGEVEDPSLSIVSQLLSNVLLGILNVGGDPEKADLVKLMREKAKGEITQLKASISANKKRVDKIRKVAKRILYKSKENPQENVLARMVLAPIEAIEASIKEREASVRGYEGAIKIINFYSYNFDASQTGNPPHHWTMQWGTSPFSFPSGSFHFDSATDLDTGEEGKKTEELKEAEGYLQKAFEKALREGK